MGCLNVCTAAGAAELRESQSVRSDGLNLSVHSRSTRSLSYLRASFCSVAPPDFLLLTSGHQRLVTFPRQRRSPLKVPRAAVQTSAGRSRRLGDEGGISLSHSSESFMFMAASDGVRRKRDSSSLAGVAPGSEI